MKSRVHSNSTARDISGATFLVVPGCSNEKGLPGFQSQGQSGSEGHRSGQDKGRRQVPAKDSKPKDKDGAKTIILVGGATKEEVDACREALTAAKIKPQVIELAAVSVINAFHISHLDTKDDVVVMVDIGAR